jgi:hypothetical protein
VGFKVIIVITISRINMLMPLNFREYFLVDKAVNFPEREWDLR